MARKPKTHRVPRTRAGGEWTEAGFWGFIRSNLRQMSRRWPPLCRQALERVRRKYTGPDKRRKWVYRCEQCNQFFNGSDVQVDHVTPCGSLRSIADVGPFVERLLCEADGLRVLCIDCHDEENGK